MEHLGAIILAAGKGKRMQAKDVNKVTLKLNNKPIILHVLDILEQVNVKKIVVVVGHAKESVMQIIDDPKVLFAEQDEALGTGHAAEIGLSKMPDDIENVFVMNGDDSFFYKEEILSKLSAKHLSSKAAITLLTIHVEDTEGLGRIVRNDDGDVIAIVEQKDATEEQKKIKEINPGCYIFNVAFLKKYLPNIEKSSVTGEYYLTSLVDIAIKNNEKIETMPAGQIAWRGINTPEELAEAERLFNQ